MCESFLSSKPEDLSSILLLAEIVLALSPCSATCERYFSMVKRLNTSLKTNMEQTTLISLLAVKNAKLSIKNIQPRPSDRSVAVKWKNQEACDGKTGSH